MHFSEKVGEKAQWVPVIVSHISNQNQMQNIFQITQKIKYTEDNLNKASHTNYFLTKQSNQILWL